MTVPQSKSSRHCRLQNAAASGSRIGFKREAPAYLAAFGRTRVETPTHVMGQRGRFSKFPYIREGRRIKGLVTITEQDLSFYCQKGPRAKHFADFSRHRLVSHRHSSGFGRCGRQHAYPSLPNSAGALIPEHITNLIAAAKNIGTTYISNGCYRLHPVEWNIGESAGMLAAYAIKTDASPREISENTGALTIVSEVPAEFKVSRLHGSSMYRNRIQRLRRRKRSHG